MLFQTQERTSLCNLQPLNNSQSLLPLSHQHIHPHKISRQTTMVCKVSRLVNKTLLNLSTHIISTMLYQNNPALIVHTQLMMTCSHIHPLGALQAKWLSIVIQGYSCTKTAAELSRKQKDGKKVTQLPSFSNLIPT